MSSMPARAIKVLVGVGAFLLIAGFTDTREILDSFDFSLAARLALLSVAAILLTSAGAPMVPTSAVAFGIAGVLLFAEPPGLLCRFSFGGRPNPEDCVPDPRVLGWVAQRVIAFSAAVVLVAWLARRPTAAG